MFLPAFAFSMIFYERLEALAEHRRLQKFLSGVAAAVVGLIVVTLIELGVAAVERSPNLAASAVIFAAAKVITTGWSHRLTTPVVLALGAVTGAFALGRLRCR